MRNNELIEDAGSVIHSVITHYNNPVFMCSFGKDSMVLLDLLKDFVGTPMLPVIFHRDPWWPQKYVFADKMIAEYNLQVWDYPPMAVTLWEGKEIMAFTNHYQIGDKPGAVLELPKNILPPEEKKPYLCGLKDVLPRPRGSFTYPWDCVFIGHKSSDQDQIAGKVPLNCDIKLNNGIGPDAAFPLRNWTDEDIWDYIDEFNIPIQEDRYDLEFMKEWPNKDTNSDYAHVCIACCDRRNPAKSVHCPKLNKQVSNVSSLVPYAKPSHTYYGEENQ